MMKQIGMQMEPIEDVQKLIIYTKKGNYIFDSAEVTAMTMQGITTYQVAGQVRFEPAVPDIPDDDVKLVSEQAGVSRDAAREALISCNGDIAEAILKVSK
ncbi:MAG: nascent polypeptide-associated complex protein [Bacteroidetes bacterium ADurb.Bin123]|nr:MAG: nascent polypeptide-associated complex protein [Bacteroidetes bacterium ADurb.Bin123]